MIAYSEHYIMVADAERGEHMAAIIAAQAAGGNVSRQGDDCSIIQCASAEDQTHLFRRLSDAMDMDFPPLCDECGCEAEDCDCEQEGEK